MGPEKWWQFERMKTNRKLYVWKFEWSSYLDIWNIYLFHRFKDKIIPPNGKNSMQNATCQNSWNAFQLEELFDAVGIRFGQGETHFIWAQFQTAFVRESQLISCQESTPRKFIQIRKTILSNLVLLRLPFKIHYKMRLEFPTLSGGCEIGPRISAQVSRSFGF